MNIVRRQAEARFLVRRRSGVFLQKPPLMPKAQNRGWKDDKAGTIVLAKKKKQNAAYCNSHYSFFSTVKTPARFWVPKPFSSCSTWLFLTGSVCDPCSSKETPAFFLRSEKCLFFLFCSQEKLSAWIGEKRRKQEFLERGCKQLTFEYLYAAHLNACEACRVVSLDCM